MIDDTNPMDDTNRRANGRLTGVVLLDVVAREGGMSVMRAFSRAVCRVPPWPRH